MEYGTESSSNLKFFTIFDGNIITREPEGAEGTTQRETSTGKTVWEKTHNFVKGMITSGGIEIKEFGKKKVPEIQVVLDNEGMVQIPMYLLSSIAEVLPNVDRTEPLKFRCYKTKKDKTVLELSQNGTKLESDFVDWEQVDGKWIPTYKNGCPAPTHDEIDGWDFRDHDKFLKKVLIDFFADYDGAGSDSPSASYTDADCPAEEDDDIGF